MAVVASRHEVPEYVKNEMMARRAAWLLEARTPSIDADAAGDVASRLHKALVKFEPERKRGYALARFAVERWRDAQQFAFRDVRKALERPFRGGMASGFELNEPARSIMQTQLEVRQLENEALIPLRNALASLVKACNFLSKAHTANRTVISTSNKNDGPPLVATWVAALGVTVALESIDPTHMGNIGRHGKRGRTTALNTELRLLHKNGVKIEEIAFLLGYKPNVCKHGKSGWNAARMCISLRNQKRIQNTVT